nr:uncharacterized protein LOC127295868 [Lolium perenne]
MVAGGKTKKLRGTDREKYVEDEDRIPGHPNRPLPCTRSTERGRERGGGSGTSRFPPSAPPATLLLHRRPSRPPGRRDVYCPPPLPVPLIPSPPRRSISDRARPHRRRLSAMPRPSGTVKKWTLIRVRVNRCLSIRRKDLENKKVEKNQAKSNYVNHILYSSCNCSIACMRMVQNYNILWSMYG